MPMPPPPSSEIVRFAPPDWVPTKVKDFPKSAGFATEPTFDSSHSATMVENAPLALVVEASRDITPALLMEKLSVIVAEELLAETNGGVGPKPVPLLAKLAVTSAFVLRIGHAQMKRMDLMFMRWMRGSCGC